MTVIQVKQGRRGGRPKRERTHRPLHYKREDIQVSGALVRLFDESRPFFVDWPTARRLPEKVYWHRESRGWSVGPDGAPLGLWADSEFVAREIEGDSSLGKRRRFRVGDLTYIDRHHRFSHIST